MSSDRECYFWCLHHLKVYKIKTKETGIGMTWGNNKIKGGDRCVPVCKRESREIILSKDKFNDSFLPQRKLCWVCLVFMQVGVCCVGSGGRQAPIWPVQQTHCSCPALPELAPKQTNFQIPHLLSLLNRIWHSTASSTRFSPEEKQNTLTSQTPESIVSLQHSCKTYKKCR